MWFITIFIETLQFAMELSLIFKDLIFTFAKIVSNATKCQKICIVLSMGRLKIVKHVKWGIATIR